MFQNILQVYAYCGNIFESAYENFGVQKQTREQNIVVRESFQERYIKQSDIHDDTDKRHISEYPPFPFSNAKLNYDWENSELWASE